MSERENQFDGGQEPGSEQPEFPEGLDAEFEGGNQPTGDVENDNPLGSNEDRLGQSDIRQEVGNEMDLLVPESLQVGKVDQGKSQVSTEQLSGAIDQGVQPKDIVDLMNSARR